MAKCLYNGVGLPAKPDCDKMTYLYEYIAQSKFGTAGVSGENVLIFSSEPLYADSLKVATGDVAHAHYVYSPTSGDTEWILYNESSDGVGFFHTVFNHLWSNHDILNKDGTLYLAASEPIPVTSAPDLDPKAMLMGHRLGSIIRAMREKRGDETPDETPETQWETLFEGTVTVDSKISSDFGYGIYLPYYNGHMFDGNDGIRLTVNGNSSIYTAIDKTNGGFTSTVIIGNEWFHGAWDGSTYADDGSDYYVRTGYILSAYTCFQARNPGTYTVKIERALFAPVAHLYNGVRLPVLPELDKATHPAMVITFYGGSYYRLYCGTAIKSYEDSDKYDFILTGQYLQGECSVADTEWIMSPHTMSGSFAGTNTIWCNTDILNEDGSTFLAGSEPIPVYE